PSARNMAMARRDRLKGFALGLAIAALYGFFGSAWSIVRNQASAFAMLAPSEAAPQVTPEMSRFRVGDRVRARVPMKISNEGRGYFNEGGGYGVPDHQRDFKKEKQERRELSPVIEGGSEGYVVGIITAGEWANRPKGWKGQPRPGVMVNWDEATYPLDVAEEMFLTEVEGESLSELHIRQRKKRWRRASDF
ncbi:unnamed protein product, partial [Effrenium voratum]